MVVLIPARAGSQRIPGKALKLLGGKPLIAWAIESALPLDAEVVVCSEDQAILDVAALSYGAHTWRRPRCTASDDAPDLTWLTLALARWPTETLFMVRRPTSPFVNLSTLRRAWQDLDAVPEATAMRAMRPVREHPMKMWLRDGRWMERACADGAEYHYGVETHSMPTQRLPRVYVQTAGVELVRRATLEAGSLTGDRLLPLFLEGPEALDLNTIEDWEEAARHVDPR